jgi:hypothetical protein
MAPLALMACGSDGSTAARDPVEFLDVRIEELAPTRAVARFQTSRPTTCEVQFGTRPDALDLTATDPNMADDELAIDHEVPLEDLRPSTAYAWRAKATDERQETYFSDVRSFETPEALETGDRINIALASAGTTISGRSSNWRDGPDDGPFGALSAIDGQMATEWASDGDGDDAWIELDLGQPRELVAFGFRSRVMADGSSIVTSVELVLDGQNRLGPFATPEHTRVYRFGFAEARPARIVRVEVRTSTGGNTGAREVQLFEEP